MKLQFKTIIFILSLSSAIYSQPELWEVYTLTNQPFVNVVIDKYRNDSLYLKSSDRIIVLHQDSIKCLVKRNESHIGLGIILGSITGGLLANKVNGDSEGWFSDINDYGSTILGILIGGLVGALSGSAAGTDTMFDIEKMDYEKKQILLSKLFNSQ